LTFNVSLFAFNENTTHSTIVLKRQPSSCSELATFHDDDRDICGVVLQVGTVLLHCSLSQWPMCAKGCSLLSVPLLHAYGRVTTKEIQLGGYTIPKGVTLFLSLGGMHTSKLGTQTTDKFWPVSFGKSAGNIQQLHQHASATEYRAEKRPWIDDPHICRRTHLPSAFAQYRC